MNGRHSMNSSKNWMGSLYALQVENSLVLYRPDSQKGLALCVDSYCHP